MSVVVEKRLKDRSNSKCELCGNEHDLVLFNVAPHETASVDHSILACKTCVYQIENPENMDATHWHCLNDSMWNENLPVQIVAWRMLARLKKNDLLDMMYLDEEALEWAKSTGEGEEEDENKIIHKDSNGVVSFCFASVYCCFVFFRFVFVYFGIVLYCIVLYCIA